MGFAALLRGYELRGRQLTARLASTMSIRTWHRMSSQDVAGVHDELQVVTGNEVTEHRQYFKLGRLRRRGAELQFWESHLVTWPAIVVVVRVEPPLSSSLTLTDNS